MPKGRSQAARTAATDWTSDCEARAWTPGSTHTGERFERARHAAHAHPTTRMVGEMKVMDHFGCAAECMVLLVDLGLYLYNGFVRFGISRTNEKGMLERYQDVVGLW